MGISMMTGGMNAALAAAALAGSVCIHAPAFAIDCPRASTVVEKAICGDDKLKAEDAALSAVYFNLLKSITDKEVHDLLIVSQRRWLTARDGQFGNDDDPQQIRKLLSREIAARTRDLLGDENWKSFVQRAEARNSMAVQYTGGPYAGHDISCFFAMPGYGDGAYHCFGINVFQNHGRVCRVSVEWASGHWSDRRTVANVTGDNATMIATCGLGYADANERCPEPDDSADEKKSNHWNLQPVETDSTPALKRYGRSRGGMSRDPDDIGASQGEDWLRACLTDPNYPNSPTAPDGGK
jgi:uncharacterized protein YecT (DUF1311 family)